MHGKTFHGLASLGLLGMLVMLGSRPAGAYPLDGYQDTGIARLKAYDLAVKSGTELLRAGALFPSSTITPGLASHPGFTLPAPDPEFSTAVAALVPGEAADYGIAVLDITDASAPRYAEVNAEISMNPASVGKIVVLLGVFQALADVYPADIEKRRAVLRNTVVTADDFIEWDSHDVPVWKPGEPTVVKRPIAIGDQANLWTYLDWMSSASSNAAASIVMREMLLLSKFRTEYPVTDERARAYFATTDPGTLRADLSGAIQSPVGLYGMDRQKLRQGAFFTRTGKERVPGYTSYATPRELMRFLVRMEQGTLVDAFSSLEIKKLLYLTDTRIRYAAAPALDPAAVYFKSGSFYSCKPEEGFTCEKYKGNVQNILISVAVVETPQRAVPLRYLVVIMSNTLRTSSAVAHQAFATRLHRAIKQAHPIDAPTP